MENDPRGLVKTDRIELVQEWRSEYFHIQSLVSSGCAGGSWPEIVAFATAILAANEAWLDSQAPTLEELRERYPNRLFGIKPNEPCDLTFCDVAWIQGTVGMPHFGSEAAALRWLADELAKRGGECHD